MKALTIKQPWVDCICYFGKRVENRSWMPPESMIGERIAIHAGRSFDVSGKQSLLETDLVGPTGVMSYAIWIALGRLNVSAIGAVAAVATLTRVVTQGDSEWFHGPYGWLLRSVEVLKDPVPCAGRQRLWDLPDDVERAVASAPTHGRRRSS